MIGVWQNTGARRKLFPHLVMSRIIGQGVANTEEQQQEPRWLVQERHYLLRRVRQDLVRGRSKPEQLTGSEVRSFVGRKSYSSERSVAGGDLRLVRIEGEKRGPECTFYFEGSDPSGRKVQSSIAITVQQLISLPEKPNLG
jgi:hypothetical protein